MTFRHYSGYYLHLCLSYWGMSSMKKAYLKTLLKVGSFVAYSNNRQNVMNVHAQDRYQSIVATFTNHKDTCRTWLYFWGFWNSGIENRSVVRLLLDYNSNLKHKCLFTLQVCFLFYLSWFLHELLSCTAALFQRQRRAHEGPWLWW